MTRIRFVAALVVCPCVALLVAAAPVPKDASKGDPTPDLKAFFTAVGKAVENEKWPAEADEKLLRDTARVIFERATKAAEQKDRKLPVDFEKLKKLDVSKECKNANLESAFVIAGVVRGPSAKDSVIFATGDVSIARATNCVIVARNVRRGLFHNCVVVADECIRANSARPRQQGEAGSVLVAGQWIRATVLDDAICHVLRPGILPTPDEVEFELNQTPAIAINRAVNVIFLNAMEDTGVIAGLAATPQNCTYSTPKTPIAR